MKNFKLIVSIAFFLFMFSYHQSMAQNTVEGTGSWKTGGNKLLGGEQLGSKNNFDLSIVTDGVQRMLIRNTAGSGFIGVGTTVPNARFHINSDAGQNAFRVQVSGQTRLYVDANGGVAVGLNSVPPSLGLFVNGNTGLGTTLPTEKLHVVGNMLATGKFVLGALTPTNTFRATIEEADSAALILGTLNGVSSYLTINKPTTSSSVDALRIRDNGTTFALFSNNAATFQLTVTGDALASGGTWQNSDKRIKRDIKPITTAMDNLMKLKPSIYSFKREDEKYKYLNLPKELQFGLIAQEVKEVFPNIVREYNTYDEEGKARSETMHSVNYTALIPVLIKGMQEQQQMIASLQEKVAQLESQVSASNSDNTRSGVKTIAGAILEQNQPNPFNSSTVIRYRLPQGTSGQIIIYDNNGILMKSFRTNESGQVTVNASDLKPGTYTYTLSVNGKLADTKKLVLVN